MKASKGFLIDTHIFIWWMEQSKKLSQDRYELINNPENKIFLSMASVWEIIIKKSKNKLKLPGDIEEGIKFSGFTLLPITLSNILQLAKLPLYHYDPFDRMLIAQAKGENLVFICDDEKIKKYDLKLL